MKLTSAILTAAVSAALVSLAGAAAPAAPAEEEEGTSVLYCNAATSDFRVAFAANEATVPKGYGTAEPFDAGVLVEWSKDPTKSEDAMRSGSRVKRLRCGEVTVEVRAGFYNANPVGELGAAEDFARLTVIRGGNKIEVSLLEESCADASIPRAQAAWGEHPVQAIEGQKTAAGYQLTLFKTACDEGIAEPTRETITWR
jgi:hypothetical protein